MFLGTPVLYETPPRLACERQRVLPEVDNGLQCGEAELHILLCSVICIR